MPIGFHAYTLSLSSSVKGVASALRRVRMGSAKPAYVPTMDAQVVREWERLSMDGLPTSNHLVRRVEPCVLHWFTTILAQGYKRVKIWCPGPGSNAGRTFVCKPVEAVQDKVELWAPRHGVRCVRIATQTTVSYLPGSSTDREVAP